MSKKSALNRTLGLSAVLLTATAFTNTAYAQSAIFNYVAPDQSGSHRYGLLNGQHVALYINDRGDLGAPYPIINGDPGIKPPSIVNPATGRPNPGNIGANGQILPVNNPPAYAALFSLAPVGNLNIGDSVKAKSEYLGAGSSSIIEGFSIYAQNGLLPGTRFVSNSSMNLVDFSVEGATSSGALRAVSNLTRNLRFNNGDTGTLGIEQNIRFQTGVNVPGNRVEFSTNFTNTSGNTLENFRYARVVDANTAFTNPNTAQRFLTDNEPNAFALTSIVGGEAIGIGVFGENQPFPAQPGSILFTADSSLGNATLLQSPFDRASTYLELTGSNGAVIKQKFGNDLVTDNDTILASTTNFIGDLAFRDQVSTALNFGNSSDSSLILLSPSLTIRPNETANFTFYYFFGGQINPPAVPEPGTVALLAASGLSGLWLRRRKKRN